VKRKRAFIVAEGPMQSTVRNFWKMIYERNCAVVVMTSSLIEGGQEASAQYWPDSGIAHYGEFAVYLVGEEKLQGFMIRNLSVSNIKVYIAIDSTYAGY
jgi:protein tyrosine phosphatase